MFSKDTLLFSNISIFSTVSFLLNHQVGLSCDSLNPAPKEISCRAAFICFLINVTNKSFLYFKGTPFFWVYHWNGEQSKADTESVLTQRDCEPVPHNLGVKVPSYRTKNVPFYDIVALSLQSAVLWASKQPLLLWGDLKWSCLLGQHHVTVKISSSMGFFQSQLEQKGEAFHSCPLSNCAQTSRAGCCAVRLKLCSTRDLKADREYCREWSPSCTCLLHTCECMCWLCSNSFADTNTWA